MVLDYLIITCVKNVSNVKDYYVCIDDNFKVKGTSFQLKNNKILPFNSVHFKALSVCVVHYGIVFSKNGRHIKLLLLW